MMFLRALCINWLTLLLTYLPTCHQTLLLHRIGAVKGLTMVTVDKNKKGNCKTRVILLFRYTIYYGCTNILFVWKQQNKEMSAKDLITVFHHDDIKGHTEISLPDSVASVIEKLPGSSAMWNVRNTDSYKSQIHKMMAGKCTVTTCTGLGPSSQNTGELAISSSNVRKKMVFLANFISKPFPRIF